jgi:hypothetical protein
MLRRSPRIDATAVGIQRRPAHPRVMVLLCSTLLNILCARVYASSASEPSILPLSKIKAGMQGTGYTIFSGDQVEPFQFEVIGVMPNLVGPRRNIVLVRLIGPKVAQMGVAAGMSGSPLFIDGRLIGALSLRFGEFTKDAIGGVTPIEEMINDHEPGKTLAAGRARTRPLGMDTDWSLPQNSLIQPIQTQLVSSGFYPGVLDRFSRQFAALGMASVQGGTARDSRQANIEPGSMVAVVLAKGDLSMSGSCTVTAVVKNRIFACGHSILGFGKLSMPLARAHVLTTIASPLAPTKIINVGDVIGTVTEDRATAVVAKLGPPPPMIPVELTLEGASNQQQFSFEVVDHPQLTPLLVAVSILNGLVASNTYIGDSTLQVTGNISVEGHSSVRLQDTFTPGDQALPDEYAIAASLQVLFTKLFTNPYEQPRIKKVELRVHSTPEKRWARIDDAWSEKTEMVAGDNVIVKVLLRPYRGAPFIKEVPITIPEQAPRGPLRVLVSDADTLNRSGRLFTSDPQARLAGLEELILLNNRQQRNDSLYVTLLQPSPTLLLQDKELPDLPVSQINVLAPHRDQGDSVLLWESTAGQWSVPMNQVITGQQYLNLTIR